jgi:hypothetical protein
VKLKGTLTVGYSHNNLDSDLIHITITDEDSRVRFIDAYMEPSVFARCVFGHSMGEFKELEVRNTDLLGKFHDNKIEFVPLKYIAYDEKGRKKEAEAAVKPFEVDGWEAYMPDMDNHHCWARHKDGIEGYNVKFFRHVDKPEDAYAEHVREKVKKH